jgi:hypothetical protein
MKGSNPMKRVGTRALTFGVGCALLAAAVVGCKSTGTPQLSQQEQSQFKGGPMPASARAEVQRRMQQVQQRTRPGATADPGAAAPAGGR